LLKAAGYRFRQIPSRVDEPAPAAGMSLEDHVLELAVLKARAVARRYPNAIVIGADTALAFGPHIIGKPASAAGAHRMLEALGGHRHRIASAACVVVPTRITGRTPRLVKLVGTAHVQLRKWTPERIQRHVALTRPLSWAGSYAVQDPYSAAVVERIEGDLAVVIGLPLKPLDLALKRLGV